MSTPTYDRGDVVDGPDEFGPDLRPYVCVTGPEHPFDDEEAVWVLVSRTPRVGAVELTDSEFSIGGLPHDPSYANPWGLFTFKYADIGQVQGELIASVFDEIRRQAAAYLVPSEFPDGA